MRSSFLVVLLTSTMLLADAEATPHKLQVLRQKLTQKVLSLGAVTIISYCSLMAVGGCEQVRTIIGTIDQESSDADLRLIREQVGQMLLVGFRGTSVDAEVQAMFNDVRPGGVILFDYDLPSRGKEPRNIESPQQLSALTAEIRAILGDDVLVAVDAEGGYVNRLKSKYGFTVEVPSAEKLGMGTAEETLAIADKLAQQLRAVGINLNLAPVVDVNIFPESPAIGKIERSFSSDPEVVTIHAQAFIDAHEQHGVLTTLKHFPGHGSATGDTHLGVTDVTDTYRAEELIPYQKLIQDGYQGLVMTAHITNRNYDSVPASLSYNIITELLRRELGFDGVVLSDDMQMGAIVTEYGLGDAAVAAVLAGVDIILIAGQQGENPSNQHIYQVRDALVESIESGYISITTIEDSLARIRILKERL